MRSPHLLVPVLALALAAAPSGQAGDEATVAIDAATVENHISPRLYGQFAEFMYENIKFGLHAELLRDRGFEEPANAIGLPRYWERDPDDRNDDPGIHFRVGRFGVVSARAHLRAVTDRSFAADRSAGAGRTTSRHPRECGAGPRAGSIPRLGVAAYVGLRRARDRRARAGPHRRGGLRVSGRRQHYVGRQLEAVSLHPAAGDEPIRSPNSRSSSTVTGRVWIDQVSLMPGDAVDEVRADVFERVKALRPGFVRWPGGNVAQDYHWMWGVGPRDERPEWINLAWSNEREPSDFGTDEFIRFCRNLGAEPHLVVNIEGRGATPEEAAAWVEYVNGATTTKYGALRAKHGHAEPFGVKTWELGNEIWGDWVRGHTDAETYARNYLRYREAMLAVDPTLRFIAVGDNDMAWNRTLLGRAGAQIDYLAIHHYYGLNDARTRVREPDGPAAVLRAVLPRSRAASSAELAPGRNDPADHQRVEHRAAGAAAALDGVGAVRRAADERLRAVRRPRRDDRRVRSGERLAGRHHPGQPPRSSS